MPVPTRPHRPRSLGAAVALLVTLCALLSGCMQLEANLSVATDGRVSGNTVVALSNRLLDQSGQRTQVVGGLFDAASTPIIPAGATRLVDRYESNGYSGVRVTFTNYPVESLPLASVGGPSNNAKLTREGDKFRFEAVIDLGSASGVVDARQIDDARLSVRITFPGIVSEANGAIDGRTVTYTPKVGEVNRFTALAGAEPTTETGSSRTVAVSIGVALAVVLAIAVAVLALRGRKRRGDAPTTGAQSKQVSQSAGRSDLSDLFDLREPAGSPPPLVAPPLTAPTPVPRVAPATPAPLPPPAPSATPGRLPPPPAPGNGPGPITAPPAPSERSVALPPPAPAFPPPPAPSSLVPAPTKGPTPPASANGTSGSNGDGGQRPSNDFQPPRS